MCSTFLYPFFFFNATATTEIYTLSLHDALPIWYREYAERHGERIRGGNHYGRAPHLHSARRAPRILRAAVRDPHDNTDGRYRRDSLARRHGTRAIDDRIHGHRDAHRRGGEQRHSTPRFREPALAKRTDGQTFRHPHRGQGKVPGHHARDIRFHRGAAPARLRYRR